MRYHVISLVCLVLQMAADVTSQNIGALSLSPSFSQRSDRLGVAGSGIAMEPKQRCVLKCPRGYLPGTCLCQDNLFPFIFTATPCRFTNCPTGEVCRMQDGKAVCVVITGDVPAIDVCNLPAEPGPCKVYIPRYFFDKADGTCKTFTYGGCQGNGNSFATKPECEKTCIVDVPVVEVPGSPQAGDPSPRKTNPTPTRRQIEICQLPSEPGLCFAHFPSFFFNSFSGQCESFVYGGCGGNENRFESVEACELACRGVGRRTTSVGSGSVTGAQPAVATAMGRFLSSNNECNLPKAAGLCLAYFPSYFYNTHTGECESFVYGGCQGNANRFESRTQCEQNCKAGTTRPNLDAACLQPKKIGRCRARLPRWFFDLDALSCRTFYYGGCGGNDNNFRSQAACEQRCVPAKSKPALAAATAGVLVSSAAGVSGPSRPQRCSQRKVTGPCRARIRSYYFNARASRCQMFTYGGCRGNANRFASLEECRATCLASPSTRPQQPQELNPVRPEIGSIQPLPASPDTCSQPKVVGFCRAAMPRFFYNKNTGRCENFIYGGCGGNNNNFRSYDACVRKCVNNADSSAVAQAV